MVATLLAQPQQVELKQSCCFRYHCRLSERTQFFNFAECGLSSWGHLFILNCFARGKVHGYAECSTFSRLCWSWSVDMCKSNAANKEMEMWRFFFDRHDNQTERPRGMSPFALRTNFSFFGWIAGNLPPCSHINFCHTEDRRPKWQWKKNASLRIAFEVRTINSILLYYCSLSNLWWIEIYFPFALSCVKDKCEAS